jgi:hypothetical protein
MGNIGCQNIQFFKDLKNIGLPLRPNLEKDISDIFILRDFSRKNSFFYGLTF